MKKLAHLFGLLLIIESFSMLLCLPFSFYYKDNAHTAFLLSFGITFLLGAMLWLSSRKSKKGNISKRTAFLIATLTWVLFSCFGSLPFMLSGIIPDFTGAFLEAMSGFTTTGASVITDIEAIPHSIIFWRALMQWIGGMGIIVLVVALVPFLGINSMSLYSAEVSGPSKEKIHPHILTSARRLWNTYIIITIVTLAFLLIGGMTFFDAITHCFSAVSTGGFGIKTNSVADYSAFLQYVLIFAMFVSSCNFTLNYFLIKGKFKHILKDEEFRFFVSLIAIAALFIIFLLKFTTNYSLQECIRHGLFQAVSIGSTTGFVSADYTTWAPPIIFIFIILMFCGGMAGSTAGGIKTVRLMALFKNCKNALTGIVHTQAVLPIRINNKIVPENALSNILAFFLIYLGVFAIGTIIFILSGLNVLEAIGAAVSPMCSYGPGFGTSGGFGNYAHLPIIAKWNLSFLMLLGRLELMTVLILFIPAYWKK